MSQLHKHVKVREDTGSSRRFHMRVWYGVGRMGW